MFLTAQVEKIHSTTRILQAGAIVTASSNTVCALLRISPSKIRLLCRLPPNDEFV